MVEMCTCLFVYPGPSVYNGLCIQLNARAVYHVIEVQITATQGPGSVGGEGEGEVLWYSISYWYWRCVCGGAMD